jgi:hypothetical protein
MQRKRSRRDAEERFIAAVHKLLLERGFTAVFNGIPTWRIAVEGPGFLKLQAERSGYLPAVDPSNREMFLSFGLTPEMMEASPTGRFFWYSFMTAAETRGFQTGYRHPSAVLPPGSGSQLRANRRSPSIGISAALSHML